MCTFKAIVANYLFPGKKKYLMHTKECAVVGSFDENGQQVVTVYNLADHIIECSATLFRNGKTEFVYSIISQWGSLFVITRTKTVFILQEKDLPTKLRSLYEKHQYDIALDVAVRSGMDVNGVLNIHRMSAPSGVLTHRYGDYLYDEDENEKAIEEYKQTIGFIEPSYVIKKFLDAQRMPQLATYLEALHMRGLANSEHTTLLINCYTKLKEKEKLHQFIYSDHAGIHFDVGMAVEVLRNAGCFEEALHLSKKHNLFMNHLKILIEDMQCYNDALDYIMFFHSLVFILDHFLPSSPRLHYSSTGRSCFPSSVWRRRT